MRLTRDEVIRILGPVDDETVAQVIETGATPEELIEAGTWMNNDESMLNIGRPLPAGRVLRLVEILERVEEEELGAEER